QAERAIAIVGKEPVVARPEGETRRGEHRLVSGAADLKKDLALNLELNFLVVQLARQEHAAVNGEQLIARKIREGVSFAVFEDGLHPESNYSIRAGWYMLGLHEHPDGSPASVGLTCAREGDRN